jgi:hypothetical protein
MKRPRSFGLGVRRHSPSKRRLALVVLLIGAMATGGAYAYWTTQGTGSGTAAAGDLSKVTIDTVSFASGRLRPGGPATPVNITVTNPNTFTVTVSNLSAGSISSDKAGCSGANADIMLNLVSLQTATIAPGTHVLVASASMGTASASACQGAVFSTSLDLGVRK